jgi:pimeloyl-ACP methyl ester carboxylesterase
VISSSPVGVDTSGLPGTIEAYRKHSAEGADVDWSDRDQVLNFMVKGARALASTSHPFDEEWARTTIEDDYDRSGGLLSATNHFLLKGGEEKRRVQDVTVPALVIHGTADPIFPIEHGEALANAVASARLVRIEGGGHELHRNDWPEIVEAIVMHG